MPAATSSSCSSTTRASKPGVTEPIDPAGAASSAVERTTFVSVEPQPSIRRIPKRRRNGSCSAAGVAGGERDADAMQGLAGIGIALGEDVDHRPEEIGDGRAASASRCQNREAENRGPA